MRSAPVSEDTEANYEKYVQQNMEHQKHVVICLIGKLYHQYVNRL